MSFLQEIIESRMIRKVERLSGHNVQELANKLFEHLLALQVLSNVDRTAAARYSQQIMRGQDFSGFRQSLPDLYNLVVFLTNQDRFKDKIGSDSSVVVPELRLKRVLRSLQNGSFDNEDFSHLMMILQRRFPNLSGRHANLRREISDWRRLTKAQQLDVWNKLRILMRETDINSDLYELVRRKIQDRLG